MKYDIKIDQMVSDILFNAQEQISCDFTWNQEQKLLTAIRDGNVEKTELCLKENIQGEQNNDREYKLSDDPLRQTKYRFIMAITLFTRAAIAGGIPDQVAFAMNDSYILSVDRCTDSKKIESMYVDAARKFLQKVTEYKVKRIEDSRRAKVEEMQRYIIKNLHFKISVNRVADSVGISPSHAMHIFKSVTGNSIHDFMQTERLKAAENLLKYSNYAISDISNYLAFTTQSGFAKQFRKRYHCSPTEFRKTHQDEAFTIHYPHVL